MPSFQTFLPAKSSETSSIGNLDRICTGYINYHEQQRSLFTMLYPDQDPDQFRIVSRDEHIRMGKIFCVFQLVDLFIYLERGCMSLALEMLNNYFHPFNTFEQETKVINVIFSVNFLHSLFQTRILRSFSSHFAMFDQAYRTSVEFPDPQDTRYIFHTGQYLDYHRLDEFFKAEKDLKLTIR
jgi:hypothetical protein